MLMQEVKREKVIYMCERIVIVNVFISILLAIFSFANVFSFFEFWQFHDLVMSTFYTIIFPFLWFHSIVMIIFSMALYSEYRIEKVKNKNIFIRYRWYVAGLFPLAFGVLTLLHLYAFIGTEPMNYF